MKKFLLCRKTIGAVNGGAAGGMTSFGSLSVAGAVFIRYEGP